MKNAAKCDTSCELQNPVNHQNFERILRFRDIPGSMCVSVSAHTPLTPTGGSSCVSAHAGCSVRRWSLGVACGRFQHISLCGGRSAGIPRRVDLHSKRARGCQCMLTIEASVLVPFDAGVVSLSPDTIASACGTSRRHWWSSCALAQQPRQALERGSTSLHGRPSQAHCSARC